MEICAKEPMHGVHGLLLPINAGTPGQKVYTFCTGRKIKEEGKRPNLIQLVSIGCSRRIGYLHSEILGCLQIEVPVYLLNEVRASILKISEHKASVPRLPFARFLMDRTDRIEHTLIQLKRLIEHNPGDVLRIRARCE